MSNKINKNLSDLVVSSVNEMISNNVPTLDIYTAYEEYLNNKFPEGLFHMEMIPAGVYLQEDIVKEKNISNMEIIKYLNIIMKDIPEITRKAIEKQQDKSPLKVIRMDRSFG